MNDKIGFAAVVVAAALTAGAVWEPAANWPVLKHYDQDHLYRVALPLGGIGTGSFSLGGRGELVDWVMMNATRREYIPAGFDNDYLTPFFAITLKGKKTPRLGKMLQGPTCPWERQQFTGKGTPNCGFAHFRKASFDGGFPFGTVNLEDRSMPVKVAVKGFSPFIPGDEVASGIPFGSLAYEVTNTSDEALEVSVAGLIPNLIGLNGSHDAQNRKPKNEFREGAGFRGIWYTASGLEPTHEAAGTMAFVTEETDGVSARLAIRRGNWSQTVHATQEWWRDFTDNGEFNAVQNGKPVASLAVKKTIAPGAKAVFAFHLFWHFPNRYGWGKRPCGNWYATQYADAWDVATKTLPRLSQLKARSLAFARAFAGCDYPAAMKERAAMNLAVYKGSGEFRDAAGRFMGFEGVGATFGCSSGSTTHVFNYEQATGFLFPYLARTKRDVEFNMMMRADGSIPCHQKLPLEPGKSASMCGHKVVDGQCGVMMKLYRDGLFSGDRAWFTQYLPQMKKSANYLWSPKGFDQNKDGLVDMREGQFNTYDICFCGPNPLAQFWYLGALRAAEEFAKVAGDTAFADECRRVFESGRRLTDEKLFNGEYYIQLLDDPELGQQMGNGCLSDQLLGQQTAHLLGLGYLAKPENVRKAAAAIAKYNFRQELADHCNYYRTYAMDEEAGLLLMTYPKVDEVKYPFTYWSEVWTGIEYTTAAELICEGLEKEALAILDGVCGRYNGLNRNPYSEIEWGHNYVRSLASWNVLMAWSGLKWNGLTGTLDFGPRTGRFFWSLNGAWGTATVSSDKVVLEVYEGKLDVKQVTKGGKPVAWSK